MNKTIRRDIVSQEELQLIQYHIDAALYKNQQEPDPHDDEEANRSDKTDDMEQETRGLNVDDQNSEYRAF